MLRIIFNIQNISAAGCPHVPIIKHRTLCPVSTFAHCFLAFDKIGMFGARLGEVKYWSHWNMSQSRQIPPHVHRHQCTGFENIYKESLTEINCQLNSELHSSIAFTISSPNKGSDCLNFRASLQCIVMF